MKECLLDTDTLSFYLKGDENVVRNVKEYLFTFEIEHLTISEITYFEVLAGLEYKKATKQLKDFHEFSRNLEIVKLSAGSIKVSAKMYGELRRKGIEIGTPDLLIAGIAFHNDFYLVTNNLKHYKQIPDLKLLNWK